jgi:hypothetical protein
VAWSALPLARSRGDHRGRSRVAGRSRAPDPGTSRCPRASSRGSAGCGGSTSVEALLVTPHSQRDAGVRAISRSIRSAARGISAWLQISSLWAKLLALGVRNGVEDLQAARAFEDTQAPAFNRLVRERIYEALAVLRAAVDVEHDSPVTDWVVEHFDPEPDDGLTAAAPTPSKTPSKPSLANTASATKPPRS